MAALRPSICWVALVVQLAVVGAGRNPSRLWVSSDEGAHTSDVAFHPHVVPPQARFHLKLIFRTTPQKANEQRVKFVGRGQSCDATSIPSLSITDAVPECTTGTSAEWQVFANGISSSVESNQFDLCYCAEGCSSNSGFVRAAGYLQVAANAPMPEPQPCPRAASVSSVGSQEDVGLSKQVQGLAAKVQQIQAAQQGAVKQLSKQLQDLEGDAGQVGHLQSQVQGAQSDVQNLRSKLDEQVATDAHRVEDFKAMLHSVLPSVALKNASASLESKGNELKNSYSAVAAEEKKWSAEIAGSTKETEDEVHKVVGAQQMLEQHMAQLRNQSRALAMRVQAQSLSTARNISSLTNRIQHLEESQAQRDSALKTEVTKQAEEIKALREELANDRQQRSKDLQKMHQEEHREAEQQQLAEAQQQQEEANAEQLNATVHRQILDFERLQNQQMQQQELQEQQRQQQQQPEEDEQGVVEQEQFEKPDVQELPLQEQKQEPRLNSSDVIDIDVEVDQSNEDKAESEESLYDGLTEEESSGVEAARQLLKGHHAADHTSAGKPQDKAPGASKPKGSKVKKEDDVLRFADNALAKADEELADVLPEIRVRTSGPAGGSGPGSVQVPKHVQDKANRLKELWGHHQPPKKRFNMAQKHKHKPMKRTSNQVSQVKVNLDEVPPGWAIREPAWLSESTF